MILPTKHIPEDQALLGVGAELLTHLSCARTVSSLWESVRTLPNVGTFERFVLAATLLYAVGAIDLRDGLLVKVAE